MSNDVNDVSSAESSYTALPSPDNEVLSSVTAPPSTVRRIIFPLCCIAAVLIGIGSVIQVGINKELAVTLSDGNIIIGGIRSALVNFTVGTTILTILTLIRTQCGYAPTVVTTVTHLQNISRTDYSIFFGGLLGSIMVVLSIIFSRQIGYSLYFTCSVAGSVIMSTIIDHYSFFNFPQRFISNMKILGCICCIIGSILLIDYNTENFNFLYIFYIILSILTGCLQPIQTACNRKLSNIIKDSINAALYSFSSGMIILFIITIFTLIFNKYIIINDFKIWQIFGGILGFFYVLTSILVSPIIGMSNYFVIIITGNLVTSTLVDTIGTFGPPVNRFSALGIIGVLITFVGGIIISIDMRRSAQTNAIVTSTTRTTTTTDSHTHITNDIQLENLSLHRPLTETR